MYLMMCVMQTNSLIIKMVIYKKKKYVHILHAQNVTHMPLFFCIVNIRSVKDCMSRETIFIEVCDGTINYNNNFGRLSSLNII